MIIDNRPLAPHFGTWHVTDSQLPTMGHVVLGLGWHRNGVPVVQFVEWRIVEDADDREDIDPDKLFDVCDGMEHAQGCWFASFSQCDEDQIAIHAPPLWADCQFNVSLPIRVELMEDEDDEDDDED